MHRKILSTFAVIALGVAIWIAISGRQRARSLGISETSLRAENADLAARAERAELRLKAADDRAAQAERDNADLLKTLEKLRATATSRQNSGAGASVPLTTAAAAPDEQREQYLAIARAFQQDLARRRQATARQKQRLAEELNQLEPAQKFYALLARAEQHAAAAEFQSAIQTYNQAMTSKLAELEVPDRAKDLQSVLAAESTPMDVTITSDLHTYIMIPGYQLFRPSEKHAFKLPPGDYEIIGRRAGYHDVSLPLPVRGASPPIALTVVCTVVTGP